MLNVQLNNQIVNMDEKDTLASLLIKHGYSNSCFAIALNNHFVPRSHYASTLLSTGDVIEIIVPMQGG